jgi:hypothetical protein
MGSTCVAERLYVDITSHHLQAALRGTKVQKYRLWSLADRERDNVDFAVGKLRRGPPMATRIERATRDQAQAAGRPGGQPARLRRS